MPALVLAGAEDGDLDAEAQRRLTLPHWPDSELHVVEGAAHLLPWEQPEAVADRIRDFWARRFTGAPVVPVEQARVIASPRVSARMRSLLAARALPDDPSAEPRALTARQLDTLRAIARIVVPQPGDGQVDLALRVDDQLAAGLGDGWRVDGMPTDLEAYRAALDVLAGPAQDGVLDSALQDVAAGRYGADGVLDAVMDAAQLRVWYEDASVDLVKHWLAHPATMAAIDFDGFANGGDGVRKQGFQLLAADQREAWEPAAPDRRERTRDDTHDDTHDGTTTTEAAR
ncbi:alpha/beta hydrolase [Sphingomonas sp. LR61]|uniref:alpha/beta fold hydrolase n=1 Tax=Sphingomonas sp. LR61 TaxID=3050234 RepID=UPI002FE3E3E5